VRCGWQVPATIGSSSISQKEQPMNWDTLKGDWKQFQGKVKESWGKLTDDDLDVIAGKRDQLLGVLQKQYGIARDEAERQVQQFERSCSDQYVDTGATPR
jgi:uncharacterized protein YjbJ (UPF0337 family)